MHRTANMHERLAVACLLLGTLFAVAAVALDEGIIEVGTRALPETSLPSGTLTVRWYPVDQKHALVVRPGVRVPCRLNSGATTRVVAGASQRIALPRLGVCLSPEGPGLVYHR